MKRQRIKRLGFNFYFDSDDFPIDLANRVAIAQQLLADICGHGINNAAAYGSIDVEDYER